MDKESALFFVVLLLFAATGIVTILGLVQKVSIEKKYLNALFSALILELIAAVLYLFSNTDFFARDADPATLVLPRADLPAAYVDIDAAGLAGLLQAHESNTRQLERIERELVSLRDTLQNQVPPYDDVTLALDTRIREIAALNDEIGLLRTEREAFDRLKQNFLVRMAELNSRISAIGGSINLRYRPQQKREIAGMLQAAFKEIGFMPASQAVDDDPLEAHALLVRYQLAKNFGQTGYLTSQVVALIILDYLSPVSSNGNSR